MAQSGCRNHDFRSPGGPHCVLAKSFDRPAVIAEVTPTFPRPMHFWWMPQVLSPTILLNSTVLCIERVAGQSPRSDIKKPSQ
jgi:hypothetical protein